MRCLLLSVLVLRLAAEVVSPDASLKGCASVILQDLSRVQTVLDQRLAEDASAEDLRLHLELKSPQGKPLLHLALYGQAGRGIWASASAIDEPWLFRGEAGDLIITGRPPNRTVSGILVLHVAEPDALAAHGDPLVAVIRLRLKVSASGTYENDRASTSDLLGSGAMESLSAPPPSPRALDPARLGDGVLANLCRAWEHHTLCLATRATGRSSLRSSSTG